MAPAPTGGEQRATVELSDAGVFLAHTFLKALVIRVVSVCPLGGA